jgi:hypothetical protein
MPIPSRKDGEDRKQYLSRCMSDPTVSKEYPENDQRIAVCLSRAAEGLDHVSAADFKMYFESYGSEEELTEDNFVIPTEEDYVTADEVYFEESEIEEWDVSVAKPGLWDNIRKKKEREGKNYKPAKKGDKDRPDPEAWKKAQSADYQGRKVQLGKPFRTPKGPKKMSVYVKNDKGNVVKVNFGDPNMKIKKSDPARRKSFRARHNCSNPGPRWKARYWSCRAW